MMFISFLAGFAVGVIACIGLAMLTIIADCNNDNDEDL